MPMYFKWLVVVHKTLPEGFFSKGPRAQIHGPVVLVQGFQGFECGLCCAKGALEGCLGLYTLNPKP